MTLQLQPLSDYEFQNRRRTTLLGYPRYSKKTGLILEGFAALQEVPASTHLNKGRDNDVLGSLSLALGAQAGGSIELLHLMFSSGDSANNMRVFFPQALDYWQEYADLHLKFHASPSSTYRTPHLDLHDTDYWKAIRLTSFALLLGHHTLLPQIAALWDYENDELDGLLERLVAPFAPGRATPPDTCTRHLPYFKLLKVFAAEPHKRPDLMARYMDGWYTASRREPYYESHTKGRDHSFLGNCAFEAAAVTYLLDIDDSSYRNHEFYPRDLIDFARSLLRPVEIGGSPTTMSPGVGAGEPLRCPAGQPCPKAGWWFAPADPSSRRVFKVDEVMPDLPSAYGKTIWQFEAQQSDGSAT